MEARSLSLRWIIVTFEANLVKNKASEQTESQRKINVENGELAHPLAQCLHRRRQKYAYCGKQAAVRHTSRKR